MISIELMGGLGNRLFQIATIEAFGQELNTPVYFADIDNDIERLSHASEWTKNAHEYLTIFKNLDWRKNQDNATPPNRIARIPFRYRRIIPEDNTRYIGYFQCEKYFENHRDYLINLFLPSDDITRRLDTYAELLSGVTCSIHIRRGNYLTLSHIHYVQDLGYYRRAMYKLRKRGIDKFIVFSDDIEWCKKYFRGGEFYFIKDKDYVELFLQSRCNHNIIGNSSFSWWGAYLNTYPNKIVVAPNKWFADDNSRAQDIVPWHWLKT